MVQHWEQGISLFIYWFFIEIVYLSDMLPPTEEKTRAKNASPIVIRFDQNQFHGNQIYLNLIFIESSHIK